MAGIGFFLDSYDIFAINLITILLGLVFWSGSSEEAAYGYGGNNGHLPTHVSQALKVSTSAGIIVGQVFFGWLADTYGRRRMYGVELGIIITSTLSCALVSPSFSVSFTGLMVFWRVMMGVGIGGDYPLSSVITAEYVLPTYSFSSSCILLNGNLQRGLLISKMTHGPLPLLLLANKAQSTVGLLLHDGGVV